MTTGRVRDVWVFGDVVELIDCFDHPKNYTSIGCLLLTGDGDGLIGLSVVPNLSRLMIENQADTRLATLRLLGTPLQIVLQAFSPCELIKSSVSV